MVIVALPAAESELVKCTPGLREGRRARVHAKGQREIRGVHPVERMRSLSWPGDLRRFEMATGTGLGLSSAGGEQAIRVSDPRDDRDDCRRDADADTDTKRSLEEGTSGDRHRARADHTVDHEDRA